MLMIDFFVGILVTIILAIYFALLIYGACLIKEFKREEELEEEMEESKCIE